MLKLKLKSILEEENISINELSKLTGVNRSSLTQLVNNTSKMVQFDTLNKIMNVLRIDYIGELLETVPKGNVFLSDYKKISNDTFSAVINSYITEADETVSEKISITLFFNLKYIEKNFATIRVSVQDSSNSKDSLSNINKIIENASFIQIERSLNSFINNIIQHDFFDEDLYDNFYKIENDSLVKGTSLLLICNEIPLFNTFGKVHKFNSSSLDFLPNLMTQKGRDELFKDDSNIMTNYNPDIKLSLHLEL